MEQKPLISTVTSIFHPAGIKGEPDTQAVVRPEDGKNRFEKRRARSMRRRGLDPTDPQLDPRTPTVPLVALMARLRPPYLPPRPVRTEQESGRALLAAEIKR